MFYQVFRILLSGSIIYCLMFTLVPAVAVVALLLCGVVVCVNRGRAREKHTQF